MSEHDDTGVDHTLDEDVQEGPPPRVILVAIDFTQASRDALVWALGHTRFGPCHFHTVHVAERQWKLADLQADLDTLRAEMVDAHDAAVAELGGLVDEDTRAKVGSLHEHVVLGDPVPEILALAQELGAELLVVGGHGHVSSRVIRDARCAVVIVPAGRS